MSQSVNNLEQNRIHKIGLINLKTMKKTQIILLLFVMQLCAAQESKKITSEPKSGPIVMRVDDDEKKQINDNLDNKIFKMEEVDVKPDFPNGIDAFYVFFDKNFTKPSEVELKGKIYLSFVIEKDGSLKDFKSLRDIGYDTGIEAIRVLKMSKKWIPAEKNGEKVRSIYYLTIPIE